MSWVQRRSILRLAAVAAVASAVLFVVGCGSSSSSSSSSPSPSASAVSVDGASITADSSLNALLPATIKSAGAIRMASALPYAPWEYYNPPSSKNFAGFDFDLSRAITAKLGVKDTFINTSFDSLILSVLGGKNDMIMADMYDNSTREKQISFVDYAYDGTSILVLKGNPAHLSNLASLAGKTVTCLSGATQQLLLESLNKQFKAQGKPQMTILAFAGTPEGLLAMKGGRAVAQVTDHSQAESIGMSTGGGNVYQVLSDPSAPHGYDPAIVGAGIAKNNTQLITAVQKALQALINEGSYQKIVAKYGLQPVSSALVNQGTATSASPTP